MENDTHSQGSPINRRQWLKRIGGTASVALAGLAGCQGQQGGGGSETNTQTGDDGASDDTATGTVMGDSSKESYTLKYGHTGAKGNPIQKGALQVANLANRKSDGRLKIQVFCCNKLGGDSGLLEAARQGTIDIGEGATNNLGGYTDAYKWADLPYIWKNENYRENSKKVFRSEIGDQLATQFEEDTGLVALAYYRIAGGFRKIWTKNTKVKTPADVEGLKIRATKSQVEQAFMNEWGINVTPVPWAEVYNATKQGVVDGVHLQEIWTFYSGIYKETPYMTTVDAMAAPELQWMNRESFNNLPSDLQDVLIESFQQGAKVVDEANKKTLKRARLVYKNEGTEVYNPTDEELTKWQQKAVKVWDQYLGKPGYDPELIKQVLDMQSHSPAGVDL